MKTELVWDYVKAFKFALVEGLTWGQLFNLAPRLQAGCAFGMVMERRSRKKRQEETETSGGGPILADVHSLHPYSDKPIPEPLGEVHNFHTDGAVIVRKSGTVKVRNIFKIMLDGGAVVNLIPHGVAARLDLHLMRNDDLKIRTATGEVVPISYYVIFDVRIAGVMATIRAYVVPAVTSYTLLLGRQWLRQVRANGDYEKETYFIKDAEGNEREVPRSAVDRRPAKADMFRVEVNEEKVISELELTQEEIKDFEDYYTRCGDAYLREVIHQSSAGKDCSSYEGSNSSNDEFSTTETENEFSEEESVLDENKEGISGSWISGKEQK